VNALLDATLTHLRALVGFDTRNPPRRIGAGGVFDYVRAQLPGFDVTVTDHGAGAVSLYALRGNPGLLFNVHLDTVPDSPQWSASPFALRVTDDRAVGLGACDIKGAAAALLAAANASDGDLALLFTTDEEGVDPRCIRAFLASHPSPFGESAIPGAKAPWWRAAPDEGSHADENPIDTEPPPQPLSRRESGHEAVIVAEPTCCKAVLAHRGIQSVAMRFQGRAGHASGEQGPTDSALHQAVRWSHAALDFAESRSKQGFGGLHGLRFNLGRIEGGIKPNMIAPEAEVRFGMRPLPSMDMDALLEQVRTLVDPAPTKFRETFRGAPLPADIAHATEREHAARALADALGIPVGDAVDFWTEAALFSAAGHATFVFGPGDIAQAHSADEWVALDQLETVATTYLRILEKTR
jgi:acetylornithine deacetylase